METNERWTGLLGGRRNGLMRVFEAMQTSHVDAAEEDARVVSGERKHPAHAQETEESADFKLPPLPHVFALTVLGMEVVLLLGSQNRSCSTVLALKKMQLH
uniref:Uncharacterized protein n=1 Tax=Globisporangium ultimum (strain ATCC 200006 / CBS 805.95 / DAOM BR144) TaxID=431595 RepID=K3X4W3_GLOUD